MKNLPLIDSLLAFLLLLVLLLSACAAPARPTALPAASPTTEAAAHPTNSAPLSGARLRILNAGTEDIQGLAVIFPNSLIEFGDIPAGATTEYQAAPEGVYSYAAYRFLRNGEETTQPVVDWVGESPRPGQSYTYVLKYNPGAPAMQTIELVEVRAEANE